VRDLASEDEVRAVVAGINVRVLDWLRSPSGPPVPVRPVNADAVVEQWRAARACEPHATPAAGPEPQRPAMVPRRRWWQRMRRS
jgi:hypothetical protein